MAVTLTAFETETHMAEAHHQFQVEDAIGTDKCMFFQAAAGDKVNLPVFKKGTAIHQADGTNLLTNNNPITGTVTELGPELSVDAPLRDWEQVIESQVDLKSDIKLPLHYTRRVARSMAETKQHLVFNYLAAIAESGEGSEVPDLGTTISADYSSRANLVTNLVNGIDDLAAAWSLAGVPMKGRILFLEPTAFGVLNNVQRAVDTRWNSAGGGFNAMPAFGPIIYNNFSIYCGAGLNKVDYSSGAPGTSWASKYRINMSRIYGVAWHPDAWAMRHVKGIDLRISYHEEYNSWLIQGRLHAGMQVMDATGLGILKSTA